MKEIHIIMKVRARERGTRTRRGGKRPGFCVNFWSPWAFLEVSKLDENLRIKTSSEMTSVVSSNQN